MNTINQNFLDQIEVIRLVRAAQDGDRDAFGELFSRYERHVFAVAMRRMGDYNEAQELSQDVFVQAMQKIGQLRQPECFGGWLRAIAHRMAINRIVRRKPDFATEPELMAATCVDNNTPLDDALKAERGAQVRDGIDQLGEMDRETLIAFYCNGRSLIEMSDEFDAPIGTIKRRLHVARKRLAKQVEELAAV